MVTDWGVNNSAVTQMRGVLPRTHVGVWRFLGSHGEGGHSCGDKG